MKNKNQKGFTLIEMLVTTAMMALMLTVVAVNIGGANSKRDNVLALSNTISDFHRSQSYALSSRNYSGPTPASAWGITFSIVGGLGGSNNTYKPLVFDNNLIPNQTIINTVKLPGKIVIKSINVQRPDNTNVCEKTLTIKFSVPYGRILQSFSNTCSGAEVAVNDEANDITTIVFGSSVDATVSATVVINGISANIYGSVN
jgi:prepilin-type N-terminal cleavage/methylation domain-containing protein